MDIEGIIKSIKENPEKCKSTGYRFMCFGLNLWTRNGFFYFKDDERRLSLWNRWRLWKAYKWWSNNYFGELQIDSD